MSEFYLKRDLAIGIETETPHPPLRGGVAVDSPTRAVGKLWRGDCPKNFDNLSPSSTWYFF